MPLAAIFLVFILLIGVGTAIYFGLHHESRFSPIRGKMYTFGNPGSGAIDTDVAPGTNLTLVEPDKIKNWGVFLDEPKHTTGLMSRLDPNKFYLVCRYDQRDQSMVAYLKSHEVNVTNPRHPIRAFFFPVKARVVEKGPPDQGKFDHEKRQYKDYAAGLSPGLARALDLNTDDEVEISFPDYSLTPGEPRR
jgi:rhodanese-related sulfurtransferase